MAAATYPVHVDATLDLSLSRWLWLVKWILVIPHLVVLAFLWVGFLVCSVVAFVAILFTGTYPRPIFEYTVGVLRWTWRVQYYCYAALGTDRYPPFTLAEVPDYPAHLTVDYPQRLSRGLVLVKWWLLAIPHYLIVGLFVGGGVWAAQHHVPGAVGLIGLLVLFAGIALAVTGRYPQSLFDFVLGMNRWVLRVAAYAGLMTDDYPPFRMDLGGHEPAGTLTVPPPAGPGSDRTPLTQGAPGEVHPTPDGPVRGGQGWTSGRTASAIIGALVVLMSLGMLIGGGVALGVDRLARQGGYLTSNAHTFSTPGYAVSTGPMRLDSADPSWASDLIGTVRVRVTAADPHASVFVGIGPSDAVAGYLAGVQRTVYSDVVGRRSTVQVSGGAPAVLPAQAGVFTASAVGAGRQELVWPVQVGTWTVVVMNADASRAVSVRADVGATVPALPWVAAGVLVTAVLLLGCGVALIAVPARRAVRRVSPTAA